MAKTLPTAKTFIKKYCMTLPIWLLPIIHCRWYLTCSHLQKFLHKRINFITIIIITNMFWLELGSHYISGLKDSPHLWDSRQDPDSPIFALLVSFRCNRSNEKVEILLLHLNKIIWVKTSPGALKKLDLEFV